jgi:hypothetical protein
MSKWSHLPNAKLIDWVLDHSGKNHKVWRHEFATKSDSWVTRVRRVRADGARGTSTALVAARRMAYERLIEDPVVYSYTAYAAVCMTLVGLTQFDDVDYILNADPTALEIYVGLGVEPAVLLQIMNKIYTRERKQYD